MVSAGRREGRVRAWSARRGDARWSGVVGASRRRAIRVASSCPKSACTAIDADAGQSVAHGTVD
jgi:hypothetical protein